MSRLRATLKSLLFALLALGMVAPQALAQAVCIPSAGGVPALSGHPNWYDEGLTEPNYWPELDDPRWRGSYLAAFGGMAASEHVTFRALRHGTGTGEALYLSWLVRADPSLDNQIDGLWVGFSQDSGPDLVFFITPFNVSDADETSELPFSVLAFERNGAGDLIAQPAPPEWLLDDTQPISDSRIWIDTLDSGPDGEWAVQVRVPVAAGFDAGVDLADSFKMWFEVQVKVPDDPICQADGCIVLYSYPDGLHSADVLIQTNSNNWADFRKDLPPTDAACIQGVSLTASDVGVASATDCADPGFSLSNKIDLLDGPRSAADQHFLCPAAQRGRVTGGGRRCDRHFPHCQLGNSGRLERRVRPAEQLVDADQPDQPGHRAGVQRRRQGSADLRPRADPGRPSGFRLRRLPLRVRRSERAAGDLPIAADTPPAPMPAGRAQRRARHPAQHQLGLPQHGLRGRLGVPPRQ